MHGPVQCVGKVWYKQGVVHNVEEIVIQVHSVVYDIVQGMV